MLLYQCIGYVITSLLWLYFIVVSLLLVRVASLRVLLIGDNSDELAITQWCSKDEVGSISSKLLGSFSFMSCISTKTDDMITSLKLFDTSYSNGVLTTHNPLSSQAAVIQHLSSGLSFLSQQNLTHFDIIYLNSALFDIEMMLDSQAAGSITPFKYTRFSSEYNSSMQSYGAVISQRIDTIQQFYSPKNKNSIVGLRTGVTVCNKVDKLANRQLRRLQESAANIDSKALSHAIHDVNDVLRNIARSRDATLYDYDQDIWSSVDFSYHLCVRILWDDYRPLPYYGMLYIKKVLGIRYSRYLHPRGASKHIFRYNAFHSLQQALPNTEILLLRHKSINYHDLSVEEQDKKTYYVIKVPNAVTTRHPQANKIFRTHMKLNEGDIFYASDEDLSQLIEGVPASMDLVELVGKNESLNACHPIIM